MGELISQRIARNARELKLHTLAEAADELVDRAEQAKLGYREFLDLVLESEVGALEGRRYASRLKLSALPHHKTLDEFDVSSQPELDPKRIAELRSLRFVERRVCSLILGPPGVGKSHVAVGLGMEALRAGYLVRYTRSTISCASFARPTSSERCATSSPGTCACDHPRRPHGGPQKTISPSTHLFAAASALSFPTVTDGQFSVPEARSLSERTTDMKRPPSPQGGDEEKKVSWVACGLDCWICTDPSPGKCVRQRRVVWHGEIGQSSSVTTMHTGPCQCLDHVD